MLNEKNIEEFLNAKTTQGKSPHTIKGYSQILKKFSEYFKDKDFKDLTREDLNGYIIHEQKRRAKNSKGEETKRELSKTTIELKKEFIANFLKWLNGRTKPDCIKDLQVNMAKCVKHIKDSELPTDEEFDKIYRLADIRMKAIFALQNETGCRIHELLILNIGDVIFDKYGGILNVPQATKTGERRIRFVNSVPILQQYIEQHPNKLETDKPLFTNRYGEKFGYHGYADRLRLLVKKAGFTKERTIILQKSHTYRHRALTRLARNPHINEFALKEYAGWTLSSKMAERYLHGVKSEDAILRMHGISIDNDKILEDKQKPIVCVNCQKLNPYDALFCFECTKPISNKGFKQFESGKQHLQNEIKLFALQKLDKNELRQQMKEIFKESPELLNELIGELSFAQVIGHYARYGKRAVEI